MVKKEEKQITHECKYQNDDWNVKKIVSFQESFIKKGKINKKGVDIDYFRLLVYGASNSGKTFFLLKKFLPRMLKSKAYDNFYVFAHEYSKHQYKQVLGDKMIFINISENKINVIKIINAIQDKIVVSNPNNNLWKNGTSMYPERNLILFDDYSDPKVTKDPTFSNLFTKFRHFQTSIIFVAQHLDKLTTPIMQSNATHFVFFKLLGRSLGQGQKIIEDRILIGGSEEVKVYDEKTYTKNLFKDWVLKKDSRGQNRYKFILVDAAYSCIYLDLKM